MNEWVVIPAHNESQNLGSVLTEVKKHLFNIIVVDDGSKDETSTIAQREGASVLRHKVNLGKGSALKTGCDYALAQGAEKIIVIDGDGQHDPQEIPRILEGLNNYQVVLGCRQGSKNMPLVFRLGNSFINRTINLLYGVNIKDSQCGYRGFTSSAYKKIRWNASDYFLETEMITKLAKNKLSYSQIDIKTIYNDRYKGTTILDGVKIVLKIIGWRLWR
ncbi:MAG TPA: glycosyltransferase family 2 protein [Candidatus Nanoarchaeia archaeon]|nr:glycosyltransferase family 2 protein [Candidatus Nanoarchaeia archaeon]